VEPRGAASWIGRVLAISFVAGTVIFLLLAFDVTAAPPKDIPGNDFVAQTVAIFRTSRNSGLKR
jgi:hypothetical protein